MVLIACVDDNFGRMFNKRRQSKDRLVINRIVEIIKDNPISMSDYSKELFDGESVILNEENPKYYFLENEPLNDFSKVEKIILFFWNRSYPSDVKFKLPENFKEVSKSEFQGNSHEKITEVHYEKTV